MFSSVPISAISCFFLLLVPLELKLHPQSLTAFNSSDFHPPLDLLSELLYIIADSEGI